MVDKTKELRQFDESFGQAFSKACAVEGAEPSSPSAEGEIFLYGVFFASFLLRPRCQKKAAKEFVSSDDWSAFGLQSPYQRWVELGDVTLNRTSATPRSLMQHCP